MQNGGVRLLQGDLGMPPSKVSRGAGGVRISRTPKEVTPRDTSQVDQTSTPHLSCGYCGKTNNTEDNCWRKAQKCLWHGSVEHQLATYPRWSNLNFKPVNVGGNKPRVPARVHTLNRQPVLSSSTVVEHTIRVFHCLAKFRLW